ncbi:unknown [Prevotella sp. CAG:1124]|nr:unknown [Prevotella sp. CAG:1124]
MPSTETAIKHAGERRFGIAAVRTGMPAAIEGHELNKLRTAGYKRHEQRRKACGDVVGHVVESRGKRSEASVTLCAVANHRVERVNHLICHHAGHPEKQQPEQRRHHAVTQILGKSLQSGLANLIIRQAGRIPSYYSRHLAAPLFERNVKGGEHSTHLTDKRSTGQTIEYQHGLNNHRKYS